MLLRTADILKLVPEFMRKDDAVKGLAAAVNKLIREPGARVKTIRVWDQIDNLDDVQLDELAYEFDIDWYSSSLPLENKRAVVKIADLVHSRRGTKWAVEQLITAYISPGSVAEWSDSGYINPKPFHFSVYTSNRHVTSETLQEFMAIAKVAMSVRSRLDGVYFSDKYGGTVVAIEGRTTPYFFTSNKCGTIPRPGTIGGVFPQPAATAGENSEGYGFTSEQAGSIEAGVYPRAAYVSSISSAAVQASGAAAPGSFSIIKCGTAKCGA